MTLLLRLQCLSLTTQRVLLDHLSDPVSGALSYHTAYANISFLSIKYPPFLIVEVWALFPIFKHWGLLLN